MQKEQNENSVSFAVFRYGVIYVASVPVRQKRSYRKTAETQKIVFDKAMAIMSEKGFQGTTVREICAEANIPIGTFYNCYKSKVDILRLIYDEGDHFMQQALETQIEGNTALDRLQQFVHNYAKLNENTGIDVMRVLFYPSNEWFSHDRPMQRMVAEIVIEGQEKGEIRSDLTYGTIVNFIFDIVRGICYNWCVCCGSFDLTERMENHFTLLRTALMP